MNFRVLTDELLLADNYDGSVTVKDFTGEQRWEQQGHTGRFEPFHAGSEPVTSVWLKWQAPASGIATFDTRGSNFDTTLGVYTGGTLGELTERVSDADSGGFLTSRVRFNTVKGEIYSIAVDGFNGATGDVVLSWLVDETEAVLPVIVSQPETTTGVIGQAAELGVELEVETDEIEYAWFKDGEIIPDESTKRLVIEPVKLSDVGVYFVRITSGGESVWAMRKDYLCNMIKTHLTPM